MNPKTVFRATLFLSAWFISNATAFTSEQAIFSPDANYSIVFKLSDGKPSYRVTFKGETILSDSRLSLNLTGGALDEDFRINKVETESKKSTWTPVVGSKSTYPDSYNQLTIRLEETTKNQRRLDLYFRAYNEGVAFRYHIPEQSGLSFINLKSEQTEFQFTGDHYVYWDDYPQATYSKARISDMGKHSIRPLLIETDKYYVAIAEAGSLKNYAPMKLNRNGLNRIVTEFRSGEVKTLDSLKTPWRVIMVASTPGTLVENHYLLQNLSPACKLKDTSWIRPGKVWRSRLDTAGAKAIIDYASLNNYQYVHYDAGWYGQERDPKSIPTTFIKQIDLHEVIQYAKARDIGLICYINKIAMSDYDMDHTFQTYHDWGIKGVKFGFVNWQSQSDMEFLYSAIEKAAKYRLIVDIHDNFRLTGIERTYPHLLTVEGILGNEETADRGNTPRNVLITSFARMIAGAGDFTPCYLNGRVISRSFQLALGVIFYSPLQYLHWYDQMDQYEGREFPELEFWKEMPTSWDDSKVIHGSIGEYMTVARKKDDAWFVGTIVDKGRSLDIPLTFLDDRKYVAKIFKEEPGQKKNVAIEVVNVSSGSQIKAIMNSGSGHAMWIYPLSKNNRD